MAGCYEISKSDIGRYSFVRKAANSQVILRSEQYNSKQSAQTGIASVQTNAPDETRYELKSASDGRPFFNLKPANSQVIGTSQMYASEASRTTGIVSVKANGPSTDIREV